ncbi:RNA polymerase-binding transcription factor DksA [Grimontia celer]|uniref:RNA polymerase-binding transcription factor DksA n=1 Tax=Grimontia celer TaxID=1796497 RepID=A0A128EZW9_9GAMM|nr:TraR/DksA C4-type zinc finger protein [Grimontia celer]CZF80077.1 RNA polymerase-binding transcription factor DksA [Grimontia celer]
MIDTETVAQLQQKLANEKEAVRSRLEDALISLTGLDVSNVPTAHLIKLCRKERSATLHEEGLRLEKIDAALCAIHTGLYGLCADCEEEIEEKDILSDPAESRCRACRTHSRYHHA